MPKCANPLFLRWVKQFHDEKDYRKRGGPPRATGYENAIRALEMCTEAHARQGLWEKLEEHCERRGLHMPEPTPKRTRGRKAGVANSKASAKAKAEKVDEEPAPTPAKRKRAPRKVAASKAKAKDDEDKDSEEDYEGGEHAEPPPKKRARRTSKKTSAQVEENGDN
ncbi:hypothetical protein DAEQUDRAFT_769111 [Daedalea quercina L-15889]|uniref:Uncharacterized protein n=1 Tax=Daedalea quercina L-15889 TaxID=1314783 RepID=A0A165LZV5_9APHY|nr:hypothetical protein DAEQUDRAFT_769111 [Daedalea quercina L-15889]